MNEFMGGNRHYETWASMDTNYIGYVCPRFAAAVRTKAGDYVPGGWLAVKPRLYNWKSELVKTSPWSYSAGSQKSLQVWHEKMPDNGATTYRSKGLAQGWSSTSQDYALGYTYWTPFMSHYSCG
ncbi:hypothetical protein [Janibacter terrae]|uniref:hypothetical protein n=1 Tax=Janibacter terrae TaxID=103817 RepID=UPI00146E85FE|nr:hypothetical protein [Janibacter terrae]